MPIANIIFAVTCWLCALIFGGIAIFAFKRKDPMHFWSGSTVKEEEITDIKAYNRANGIMWAFFAAFIVFAGILSLINIKAGGILLSITFVPGILVLIIAYKRIYKKYQNPLYVRKNHDADSKTLSHKAPIAVIVIVNAVILVSLSLIFYNGEKAPDVYIKDDFIQIEGMYGLNISFSEIADFSLIEKSMKEMGIGMRTNGYGGFMGALKGNFKSEAGGNILLFAQSNSSPTIKIEREGKKDVYISFKDSEKTEKLFQEMTKKISLN